MICHRPVVTSSAAMARPRPLVRRALALRRSALVLLLLVGLAGVLVGSLRSATSTVRRS